MQDLDCEDEKMQRDGPLVDRVYLHLLAYGFYKLMMKTTKHLLDTIEKKIMYVVGVSVEFSLQRDKSIEGVIIVWEQKMYALILH